MIDLENKALRFFKTLEIIYLRRIPVDWVVQEHRWETLNVALFATSCSFTLLWCIWGDS